MDPHHPDDDDDPPRPSSGSSQHQPPEGGAPVRKKSPRRPRTRSPVPAWSSANRRKKTLSGGDGSESSREPSPLPVPSSSSSFLGRRSASPPRRESGGASASGPSGPSGGGIGGDVGIMSQPNSPSLGGRLLGRMASKFVSKSDAHLFQSIKVGFLSRLSRKRFAERGGKTEEEGASSSSPIHTPSFTRTPTPTPPPSRADAHRPRTFSSCCRTEVSFDTDLEGDYAPEGDGGGGGGGRSYSKNSATPPTTSIANANSSGRSGDGGSYGTLSLGESGSLPLDSLNAPATATSTTATTTTTTPSSKATPSSAATTAANATTTTTETMAPSQHHFHTLMVHLHHGRSLVARDACGSSDPYVKVKVGDKLLYKSKTINRDLNPTWDEIFILPIVDINQHVIFKVFDYDWGLSDDFMGMTSIDPGRLPLNKQAEYSLILTETNTPGTEYMGEIVMSLTLVPRTLEEKEIWMSGDGRFIDTQKRAKSQVWSSVLTVLIIEAKNLSPGPDNYVMDSYVKFRLGTQKYKTRTVSRTTNPKWLEQFDFYLYEGQPQILDLQLFDEAFSKDYIGRVAIDIGLLEKERTHQKELKLQEGNGQVFLLLTVSGTHGVDSISDLINHTPSPEQDVKLRAKYSLTNSLNSFSDVGTLTVKVFEAQGLAALDIGGKSDPFVVLELVNARLQTQTEYRTLNPIWNKIFTFAVKDFTSILDLTVFDEDKNHKQEFLGRLSLPLWEIKNGEKKWHLLKDRKLLRLAAGNCPKILLELSVHWNPLRAAVRVLDPPEAKLLVANQGFRRETFLLNIDRLKRIGIGIYDIIQYLESCLDWESPVRSVIALVTYQVICYTFQPCMLPLFVLLFMFRQWFLGSVLGRPLHDEDLVSVDENILDDDDDDKDEDDQVKKLSLRQKLQAVQEATQTLQNVLGDIASTFESAKNTFRMKIPFITWLVVVALILGTVILYFVPVRYLAMAYGFHKFFKPILRPNAVPTNELYNIVLRVPDNLQLIYYRPLNPASTSPSRSAKPSSAGERSKSPPGATGSGSKSTSKSVIRGDSGDAGGGSSSGSIGKEPKKKFKFW
ncbi:multiple C2 and transmembrane domain-containing protein isoform X3 [Folsomia candida]|uniref:multiple C2 and transmembrane domain-containing protein isoform X3 n=1 Tax=Folsomia candida TaxID=158441 RepID=UPI0016051938|nr:multiple C2 and transmembrane domain-containing protein isoform X3 [Folsomia candida]